MKTNMTLIDTLQQHAADTPESLAYAFLKNGETIEQQLNYVELEAAAKSIGATLQMVVGTGERALLLYQPGIEFTKAFLGCIFGGVIAVPAYPPNMNRIKTSLDRLKSIVEDSEAKIILTTREMLPKIQEATSQIPGFEGILIQASDSIPSNRHRMWQHPGVVAGDTAFLQYTSGSTSAPKGVMVSHENVMYNEEIIKVSHQVTGDFDLVSWLPLFHDMGLIGIMLHGLYMGRPTYLMSPMSFLKQPVRWLKAISDRKENVLSGAPNFAYDLCLRRISEEQMEGLDLSRWDCAFNGAETVRRDTLNAFYKKFSKVGLKKSTLWPCYGLAEATLMVTGTREKTDFKSIFVDQKELEQGKVLTKGVEKENTLEIVSCGDARLEQEIVIAAPESGEDLGEGKVGEIWVKGKHIAKGYWKNEAATKELLQATTTDGRGPFLRTGDLGFLHEGELYVTGRIKEIIIVRGRCLYPQDLEVAVEKMGEQFPEIRPNGSVAFALTGDHNEGIALIVEVAPRRNKDHDAEQLVQAIQQTLLENFEVGLAHVVLIKSSIPKTSSGKKMRNACRKILLAGIENEMNVAHHWALKPATSQASVEKEVAEVAEEAEAAIEMSPEALETMILKWIAEETQVPVESLSAEKPFTDFALDSLSAISLVEFLERKLGRTLSTTLVYDYTTPRALVQHLLGAKVGA